MSQFEWTTEEDSDDWEIAPDVVREKRPFPYRTLLLIPITLLLAYVGFNWRVNSVVDKQLNDTTIAIADAETLLLESVAMQDIDIVTALLSDKDPIWRKLQLEDVENGRFLSLPSLSLTAKGMTPIPDTASLAISEDYQTAMITADYAYESPTSDTITFKKTLTYAQEEGRWILQPPVFNRMSQYTGRFFAVFYGEDGRDTAIRLHRDLNERVEAICAELALTDCNRYPALNTSNRTFPIVSESNDGLYLPDPAYIGIPQDEASYQALLESYAAQVIPIVVERNSPYRCCPHRAYVHAITERFHAEPAIDYATLAQNGITLQDAAAQWDAFIFVLMEPEAVATVRAAVAFLATRQPNLRDHLPKEFDPFADWFLETGDFEDWETADNEFRQWLMESE